MNRLKSVIFDLYNSLSLRNGATDTERHAGLSAIAGPLIIIPAKAREYVFTGVGLSVCLSVTTITRKIVNRFVPNFYGKVPRGKGKIKFVFRYDR